MLKNILIISFSLFFLLLSGYSYFKHREKTSVSEDTLKEKKRISIGTAAPKGQRISILTEKVCEIKDLKLVTPIEPFSGMTSSFCEYRSTHPHGGIDFSTMQKNGLPVLSTLDGEVREVKITYRGYGKALYLYHKDGLLSVYAHLSKFHSSIEEYLKPYYEKSIYPGTIQIKPPIKFKAGEVIAYSGESGDGFPHLHYELRKNNNPINPLPYFSFKNVSKTVIKKLIITPETPTSSINGKFGKTSFIFPIKNEIKINGSFSLGIEAYDFYNGNRRGIQKIELYLNDELVSRISPDIFSYDNFYGIRFIYDGNFSRFSPIKLAYNLNPQKENPFDFIQGRSSFELEEGKYNFEVVVYGASDSLRKKFKINVSKPLQKPPKLKFNIFLKTHFFLIGQEGQSYPSSIKKYQIGSNEFYIGMLNPSEKFILPYFEIIHREKKPVPFCFYLKKYENKSNLETLSPCLYIEPKDIGLSKKIEIYANLKDAKNKEKIGIYRLRGNLYCGGKWEGDKLKAEVFAPEDYVVLKDNISPQILKAFKKYGKVYIYAKDIGSGIPWDGVQIEINEKTFILEYDLDHNLAIGEIPQKGEGIIVVKDNAKNKIERKFSF